MDFYFTCDGKKVATMEQVIAYNQQYCDNMNAEKDKEEVVGRHR